VSTQISTKEAAQKLNITQQSIRKLCTENKLNAKKVGRNWVVKEESVIKYGLHSSHLLAKDRIGTKNHDGRPIALSFFSGAMGLDIGIEKAGFDVLFVSENDNYCRQTIKLMRPNIGLLGDINNITANEVLENAGLKTNDDVDLIIGGPPCQAFSTAGKRRGFNDNRGNVFLKFIDIAFQINPKYLVIENVRGLLSTPMMHRPHNKRGKGYPDLGLDEMPGGALSFVLQEIKKAGYAYSFNLYNSANFGTPQTRERVIIICSRNGKRPPFLVPTHSENGQNGLKKWRNFKQAVKGLDEHHHLNFPEKRLKYYRKLDPGQNWRDLPKDLQKKALGNSYYTGGGKTGFLRRVAWNRPCPTVVTHPAMPATDLAHPEEDRPLSIEEYKRIQQFPDNWELAGPLTQQYKQVGNAVPIGLGHAVGKLIYNLINGNEVSQIHDFKYSRYKKTNDIEWKEDFKKRVIKKELDITQEQLPIFNN
jgi:DNA (cytosine-5)-methyltransferase 1